MLDSLYLFGIEINWYWLCNITGGIMGILLILLQPFGGEDQMWSNKDRVTCVLWLSIFYILISKVAITLEEVFLDGSSTWSELTHVFMSYQGRWYGAILGITIFVVFFFLIYREERQKQLFEILMTATCLSLIFGKLGCFLSGHYGCHGLETSLPWGVTYPYGIQLDPPVHPIQLYDALFYSLLFLALVSIKWKAINGGWVFLLSSALYGLMIGFIRAETVLIYNLRLSQISYLVVLVLLLIFYLAHGRERISA